MDINKLPNVRFTQLVYDDHSAENREFDELMKSGKKSLQWIADKFAKNNCLRVINAKWDIPNKVVNYTLMKSADAQEVRAVSFDEICKGLDWKSFKIVGDHSAIPVEMTQDEIRAPLIEKIEATKIRDKKWFKDHPDADPANEKSKKAKNKKA